MHINVQTIGWKKRSVMYVLRVSINLVEAQTWVLTLPSNVYLFHSKINYHKQESRLKYSVNVEKVLLRSFRAPARLVGIAS